MERAQTQTRDRDRESEADRIRVDVRDALAREPELDASDVEVVTRGNDVTLRGVVDDAVAMRRAEEVAARVRGVGLVRNEMQTRDAAVGAFADERGPQATEFGTADATKATHDVDNDDGFHGN